MTARERGREAAEHLRARGAGGPFACALVLGTGLGGLAAELEEATRIPYRDIPHFPRLGVSGHGGEVVAGRLGGRPLLVLAGRAHPYETGDSAAMHVPVAALAALDVPALVLTNAAGGIRDDLGPGAIAVVSDHLALGLPNPLVGLAGDDRFVPMGDAYDPGLRAGLLRAGARAGVALGEGVYMWFSGPSFETAAEIRMARMLGADLVGMSTVPEVILARYHRLRVAALSVVTNHATGLAPAAHSHAGTQEVAAAASVRMGRLIRAFVEDLPHA